MIRALCIILAASPVAAQECTSRDEAYRLLADRYGEARQSLGTVTTTTGNSVLQHSQTRLFEVWANPATGTWTILRTDALGQSCVMASGSNWTPIRMLEGDPA